MSVAPPPCDWQTNKHLIKERGQHLLETGLWSDCRFIVGSEPNQQVFDGHKLFLAMSSPVFEAMFFGGMPEKDPIAILDVQPEAFKALLEYIYTDKINLTSFDQACELCYGAKKYMLPHLLTECTTYLWSDLHPKNACRAYEFSKLFEEPRLMAKCFKIICEQTQEVLNETSFEDVEITTVITLLEQDELNVNSELDLFDAVCRYVARQKEIAGAKVPRLDDGLDHVLGESSSNTGYPTIRDAVKKIRFLTLSPQQFADGPGKSNLLSESEKFSILMNICSPSSNTPMPEDFTICKEHRKRRIGQFYHQQSPSFVMGATIRSKLNSSTGEVNEAPKKMICTRRLLGTTECMNTSVLDCAVTFMCDKNVCVYGMQIPTQLPTNNEQPAGLVYAELLYAHLLDAEGSRLTYTHFTSRVQYDSLIEISFNRPVYIQKNKQYKVGVVLNKVGCYPIGTYPMQTISSGVTFTFAQSQGGESVRDGLVRSIIFAFPPYNPGLSSITGNHKMQPV